MKLHDTKPQSSDWTPARRGISLTEILIGIMVLGIGVISLATLFPIGLLRMKRAVNDVRGTIEARSAWNEVRVRNLIAPPHGPLFAYPNSNNSVGNLYSPMSADPGGVHANVVIQLPAKYPFRPTTGQGIPVVIDPMWMIENSLPSNPNNGYPFDLNTNAQATALRYRLGLADLNQNSTLDFLGGEGLFRSAGGFQTASLAAQIFSSPDDLTYGDSENFRMIPYQAPSGLATPPPYLTPTYGVPFHGALSRERRYTWLMIARKASAAQIYTAGQDGAIGLLTADDYDLLDNHGPEPGPDGILGYVPPVPPSTIPTKDDPTYDDPARDMSSGLPVPSPIGPFDVTIVVFYNRDLAAREITYANQFTGIAAEPSADRPVPIFSPVPRTITIPTAPAPNTYGPYGANEATLVRRNDAVPFPDIVVGGYVLDATFDGSVRDVGAGPFVGPRGGHVYRVTGKTLNEAGNILILSLDRPARPNGPLPAVIPPYAFTVGQPPFATGVADPCGYVLTYLKGAVGVFEKQVP